MIFLSQLVLMVLIIDTMLSVSSLLPSANIILDVQKGFAIRRRGIYSKTFERVIIHTFVPIDDLCTLSPTAGVCIYVSHSAAPNILELSTMLSHRTMIAEELRHNHERTSSLIEEDISRILSVHNPALFINKTKEIFYYFDDHFHIVNDDNDKNSMTSTNLIDYKHKVLMLPFTKRPARVILEQILNNRIAFDFIAQKDIEYLYRAMMSNISTFINEFDMQELTDSFLRLVLAQKVYALRTCSFNIESTGQQTPCLLVSTLLVRPLPDSSSMFIVYQPIPFPVLIKNKKYTYSSLPSFIGLNMGDNTVAIWTGALDERTCSFSIFVQCNEEPLIVPLSASPCLLELFGEQIPTISACPVTRSKEIQPSIMHVGGDLWLFYNTDKPYQCHALNNSTEDVLITEAGLHRIPCGTQLQCANIKVPTMQCTNETIVLRRPTGKYYKQLSDTGLSLNNFSNLLLKSYSNDALKTFENLEQESLRQKPILNRLLQEFGNRALGILTLLALIIILIIAKILRGRILKEVDLAQKDLNKLIRDFYEI
jgi:hypothetical protein